MYDRVYFAKAWPLYGFDTWLVACTDRLSLKNLPTSYDLDLFRLLDLLIDLYDPQ